MVPQIVMMTKVDSGLVLEDIKNVYHSLHIQKMVREGEISLKKSSLVCHRFM